MSSPRLHQRICRPSVEVGSPLIDCHLVDLSPSGLGFETSIGLRLGVPYPFRLRDGDQDVSTEAVVRWCRLVRNEKVDGGWRPVYRVGASFVDWQAPVPSVAEATTPADAFERQIDDALDDWLDKSWSGTQTSAAERTIVHNVKPKPRR